MKKSSMLSTAALVVAGLFAQDARAQTQKDTIQIKSMHTARDGGYVIVSEKNDTLHLWRAQSEYESGEFFAKVTVGKTGQGANARGTLAIDANTSTVYVTNKLSGAQAMMLQKTVGDGNIIMNRCGGDKIAARFTL